MTIGLLFHFVTPPGASTALRGKNLTESDGYP